MWDRLCSINYALFTFFLVENDNSLSKFASTQEYSPKMYLSSSSRTFTSRCSFKYSQIRCCSIFKGILSFTTTNPNPKRNFSSSNHFQVLPNDPSARRLFVTSGGLKKIQELKPEPGSALKEHINNINACFPEEIVRYYTPGYSEQLLQRVDTYKPSDHTGASFMNNHYSNSLFISPTS